jgi:Cytochrome P460
MKRGVLISVSIAGSIAAVAAAAVITTQEKYAVKVPNGLALSEFRGYESWPVVAVSLDSGKIAVILGNPQTIGAYMSGIPGDGRAFPDGSKLAKIHWISVKNGKAPGDPTVPGTLHDVDFMVKDSRRFADSGGWGYAVFDYDAASGTLSPDTQEHDAKCGLACHTVAKSRDFVFTEYGRR